MQLPATATIHEQGSTGYKVTSNPRISIYCGCHLARSLQRRLELLRKRESGDYVPAIKFAREHLRAGHRGEAFKWLTLACEERNVCPLTIASDPFYDPLRADLPYGARTVHSRQLNASVLL